MTETVTIYRDGILAPIEYENVEYCFWTANDTVLTLVIYNHADSVELPEHYYVGWLREHFVWYKVERDPDR